MALLPSGLVLIAGGAPGPLNSAELFDPASATWTSAGTFATARADATLTILPDGRAFLVGGELASASGSAECNLFDPARGRWLTAGSATGRYYHAGSPLADGRVLATGGWGAVPLSSAQVFDPAADTWTAAVSLTAPRAQHTLTLLPDGRLLAASGASTGGVNTTSAEVYVPASGTWSATGGLTTARASHSATILPTARVLVVGGGTATCELYDAATGTWTGTGSVPATPGTHTATMLPSGRVLLVGLASFGTTTYLYDPATGTWTATGALATGRASHTATLLPSGRVLVAGGTTSSAYLASAERYDEATGTWTTTANLAASRAFHTATLLARGQVLVLGGHSGAAYVGTAEVYDPTRDIWTLVPSLGTARGNHLSLLLPDGRVLASGGQNGSGPVATAEAFDPGLDFASEWQPVLTSIGGSAGFPVPLGYGASVTVAGLRFRGVSEAGSGVGASSPADVPIVTLTGPCGGGSGERDASTGRVVTLPATSWSGTSLVFTTPTASGVTPGHYLLRVTVAGIPSAARIVRLP